MFSAPPEETRAMALWSDSIEEGTGPVIGFSAVQKRVLEGNASWLLISTLPDTIDGQKCLLKGTLECSKEEPMMNTIIESKRQRSVCVIVYGRNHMDESVNKKWKQIRSMGFTRSYKYTGGMFEWLLLQDVYGRDNFPTTSLAADILEFEPK